ncbi:MAG: tyrosine-type recombinase/integrase [Bacteroidota bacterium]
MKLLATYEKHLESKGRVTQVRKYQIRWIKLFQTWLLDVYAIDDWRDVTLDHLLAYGKHLHERRKSDGLPTTKGFQNAQLYALKKFFEYLKKTDRILIDPTLNMPRLNDRVSIRGKALSAQQALKLLQQPNLKYPFGFRDRCILELLYSTGIRGKELCNLSVFDIDFDENLVRVRQGKGSKDRFVPFGKAAASYLKEYINRVRPIFFRKHPGRSAGDKLFVTQLRKGMSTATLRNLVLRYAGLADLPRITTHSLRHTCATLMLKGGASVRHVQEMLGHSQIKTTQRYTTIQVDDLKKVHAKTAPSERRKSVQLPSCSLLS